MPDAIYLAPCYKDKWQLSDSRANLENKAQFRSNLFRKRDKVPAMLGRPHLFIAIPARLSMPDRSGFFFPGTPTRISGFPVSNINS